MSTHRNHRARLRLALRTRRARYVADDEALLVLSDHECREANFPEIRVVFREVRHEELPRPLVFELKFQRHPAANPLGAATGDMDTCRPWSEAYAGRVELSHDARLVWMADPAFRHSAVDQLAIKLGRKLAQTIGAHDLHLVSSDECVQVVLALQKLGVTVRAKYQRDQGGLVDLVEVDGRYANQRAIDAAHAAAPAALPAPAGEPTDGSR